jgi:hypothetical protein
MTWMTENLAIIQAVVALVTAVVWVVYLQLIVGSLRRQRRSMVLIGLGAGDGLKARCFVANMGGEPIYLQYLLAQREIDGQKIETWITDRDELSADDISQPSEATNQGPLCSGDFVDVGSVEEILWRIDHRLKRNPDPDTPVTLTLTVFAATGHSAQLAAARRSFRVGRRSAEGGALVVPLETETRQIRSWRFRKRLLTRLRRETDATLAEIEAPSGQSGSSSEGITGKNSPPDQRPNHPS